MMYQSSHFHQATPLALSLIADTVLNPSFHSEEIEAQRDAAFYEVREIQSKPEMILPEILHNVAYDDKGLGNPLLCPEDRIFLIDKLTLRNGMKEWYRPDRIVVAGAGMPHEELVELTDKFFSSLKSPVATQTTTPRINANNLSIPTHLLNPSTPSVAKSLTRAASYLFPKSVSSPTIPKSPTSTYTGGHRFILDPKAEFNHLYVAYEGVGIHDDDIYALATIQVLLGGGGSFSAGAFHPLYGYGHVPQT
jgi:processing peptidase subunit alpha